MLGTSGVRLPGRIIAWCGHRARRCGAVRHKQECPRETHAPVVVVWCQTCLVEAAAASMPCKSHQQQISVASLEWLGSSDQ